MTIVTGSPHTGYSAGFSTNVATATVTENVTRRRYVGVSLIGFTEASTLLQTLKLDANGGFTDKDQISGRKGWQKHALVLYIVSKLVEGKREGSDLGIIQ